MINNFDNYDSYANDADYADCIESNETYTAPTLEEMDKKNTILEKFAVRPPEIYYSKDGSGLAKLFADVFHTVLRFNIDLECWMFFDGKRWITDKHDINVRSCAKKFANVTQSYVPKQGDYAFKEILDLGKLAMRTTLIRDAEDVHTVCNSDFNKNPNLFNCLNGTYDLESDTFHNHQPSDMLTELANVTYDPNAQSAELYKFLTTIFDEDMPRIQYVLRTLGLSLTGHTNEHCLFVFLGESSRNGKSTLLNTFLYMMGSYGVNIDIATLAQRRYFNGSMPSSDLARIQGKRFILSSEPPQTFVFDETRTKAITGGDLITARYLHQNDIQFKPVGKVFIGTNHRPLIEDDSIIESRRIRIVPFNHHFSPDEQDITLPEKLKASFELSTLLNFCIGGYRNYKKMGLNEPDSVTKAMAANQTQESFVEAFFENELIKGTSSDRILVSKLYPKYADWSCANGLVPIIKEKFMNLLRAKNILIPHGTIQGRTLHNIVIGYKYRTNVDESSAVKHNETHKPVSDADNVIIPTAAGSPKTVAYTNEAVKAPNKYPDELDKLIGITNGGLATNEPSIKQPTPTPYQESYYGNTNYSGYQTEYAYYSENDQPF